HFSPDGSTVAYVRTVASGVEDIYLMPIRVSRNDHIVTDPPVRLTNDNRPIYGIAWSNDGRSIVAASQRQGSRWRLWRVPISGGKPVMLSGTEGDPIQPVVARTHDRLAYVSRFTNMAIWRAPVNGEGPATPLIVSTNYDSDPQYSPDGRRIAFRSARSGSGAIWTANSDGSGTIRVADLNGPLIGPPRWSPDGSMLAFDSRVGEQAVIRIAYSDGAALSHALPSVPSANDMLPAFSRDGRSLY